MLWSGRRGGSLTSCSRVYWMHNSTAIVFQIRPDGLFRLEKGFMKKPFHLRKIYRFGEISGRAGFHRLFAELKTLRRNKRDYWNPRPSLSNELDFERIVSFCGR